MRLVIIFCLFSSFIFGQGILPNQIQTSPYSGGFLRSIDKVWDENEQDSVYIYEHVDSSFLANFMTHADSIYISGDTIFLRDGSGFVKLAAGWGLDVSTSGNTVTYKADTSKLATLTDIGGFFTLPTFTAGSVIFSNGTTLAQDNSSLFFDDSNNRLGVLTNSPNYSLDVNGTGWFRQTIYLAGIGANLRMVASGGTLNNANDGGFYTSLSGNIYLGNWDSNRGWVILSGGNIETLGSGNLGVGTSPSYKIHSGGSIGANGTIYALNQGGNFRMKADGTSANDGGFYTSAGGNIYLGNWDSNRGWAILSGGNIETLGSGTLTVTNLAGSGTRMVTASSAGLLSTSAIPTGTVTSIATNNGITGGTITSSGTIGLTGQALAVHNLSSNGLIARTSSGNVSARTITAGTGISVSNGDGVSANPTISTNQSVNYGAIYNSSFYSESWTTGTPKKITMSSTSASSGVSISSSVLTTSSSGDYEISYSVGLQHTSYADWYCACYNSSGSSSYGQTWTTSRRDGTSLRSTLSMSTIVPLSSGDTISLWCYPDTGSGNDSVFYPKLSIKKIN